MIYAVVEPLIVGAAILAAAGFALRKWRPSKERTAGCGTGCSGCENGRSSCASPAHTRVQTVALPQSRRAPR